MRLVTFGCSNTYGQGLKDCHWDDQPSLTKQYGPSQYAWPQLVADKLGIQCHNASIPGASNKLIMHQIISFPLLPTDTVVVMWSFLDRFHLLKNNVSDYCGHPNFDEKYKHKSVVPWQKDRQSKYYYRFVYDQDDHRIMTGHYISYARLYLEKHNLPNLHTSCDPILTHPLVFDIQHEKIRNEYPKALDNSHPGSEAHKETADRIYTRMTEG